METDVNGDQSMGASSTGLFVIMAGLCVVIVGVLIYSGALSWFGHLPGDIRFGSERARVFIPITSMLLVSLILSLIVYLLQRFL